MGGQHHFSDLFSSSKFKTYQTQNCVLKPFFNHLFQPYSFVWGCFGCICPQVEDLRARGWGRCNHDQGQPHQHTGQWHKVPKPATSQLSLPKPASSWQLVQVLGRRSCKTRDSTNQTNHEQHLTLRLDSERDAGCVLDCSSSAT